MNGIHEKEEEVVVVVVVVKYLSNFIGGVPRIYEPPIALFQLCKYIGDFALELLFLISLSSEVTAL